MAVDLGIIINNPHRNTKQISEEMKRITTTKVLNKNQEQGNPKSKYQYLIEHNNKREKIPTRQHR